MTEVITVTETNTVVVPGDDIQVIQTTNDRPIIEVGNTGPQGPQGSQGPPGAAGGTFEEDFDDETSVTITHDLNKYPAVTILDTIGNEVFADIQFLDLNSVRVTFATAFSGKVVCN